MLLAILASVWVGTTKPIGASGAERATSRPFLDITIYRSSLYRALADGGAIYLCKLRKATPENVEGARWIFGRAEVDVTETIWGHEKKSLLLRYGQWSPDLPSHFNIWPVYPPQLPQGTEVCVVVVHGAALPGTEYEPDTEFPAWVFLTPRQSGDTFAALTRIAGVEKVLETGTVRERLAALAGASSDGHVLVREFADDGLLDVINRRDTKSAGEAIEALEAQIIANPEPSKGDLVRVCQSLATAARSGGAPLVIRVAAIRALAHSVVRLSNRDQSGEAAAILADAVSCRSFASPAASALITASSLAPVPAMQALSPKDSCDLKAELLSEVADQRFSDAIKADLEWLGAPK
jgi:hypothetical protein